MANGPRSTEWFKTYVAIANIIVATITTINAINTTGTCLKSCQILVGVGNSKSGVKKSIIQFTYSQYNTPYFYCILIILQRCIP